MEGFEPVECAFGGFEAVWPVGSGWDTGLSRAFGELGKEDLLNSWAASSVAVRVRNVGRLRGRVPRPKLGRSFSPAPAMIFLVSSSGIQLHHQFKVRKDVDLVEDDPFRPSKDLAVRLRSYPYGSVVSHPRPGVLVGHTSEMLASCVPLCGCGGGCV